jgi:tRNA threonylcarbamoyladenosine biosynthesis protein TsaE
MATFTSHSPEETFALGEAWGQEATAGWLIGLTGDLGAGKTQLVKGLARGLGISSRIQSPTYALVNEYNGGRVSLAHLDLYRLDTPEQIRGAGLEEFFHQPRGVVVVEWCERWPEFRAEPANLSARLRRVRIEWMSENTRRITYEDTGN